MVNSINISRDGTKFICDNFELFVSKPYQDPGGLWTVGYGTRITEQLAVKYQGGISQDQAYAMYENYIQVLTKDLQKCPFATFKQYQIDAIYSLSYNIGFNAFQHSTVYHQLMLRQTDLSSWKEWTHDNRGNVDEGLIKRREMELKLFIYGQY
jgi:lysozyme